MIAQPPPNAADSSPVGWAARALIAGAGLLRGTMNDPFNPFSGRMGQQVIPTIVRGVQQLSQTGGGSQTNNPPPINPGGNAPPPGNNPPIPLPTVWNPYPFIIGSTFYGSKGPRKRKRPKKRKPRYWPNVPIMPPGQWEEMEGPDVSEARGPIPTIPDTMPPPVPVRVPARVAVGAAARWLNPFIWIFWPSRTADNDTIPSTAPRMPSKGPSRRPRIRTPGTPGHPFEFPYDPIEVIRPYAIPGTKPRAEPKPEVRPEPVHQGNPPEPKPLPRTVRSPTRPAPVPRSTPTSTPTWYDPLLPLLLQPFLQPSVRSPSVRAPVLNRRPLTPPLQAPLEYPRPIPVRADPCQCTQTQERKRKRKTCTNPIVSRRTRTKDGRKLRTITRELKCPA